MNDINLVPLEKLEEKEWGLGEQSPPLRNYVKEVMKNKMFQLSNNCYSDKFEIQIDGLKCDLFYLIDKKSWSFHFESNSFYSDGYMCDAYLYYCLYSDNTNNFFPEFLERNENDLITEELLLIFINKIYELMNEFKINKLIGQFEEKNIIQGKQIRKKLFEKFIPKCDTTCTVCYETTWTKIGCEHVLCIECINKIQTQKCPICRAIICSIY